MVFVCESEFLQGCMGKFIDLSSAHPLLAVVSGFTSKNPVIRSSKASEWLSNFANVKKAI